MLIGNYSVLNKTPGRWFGGTPTAHTRANFNNSGSSRGVFFGFEDLGFDPKSAIPYGYNPPYSWIIAQDDGGISSINQISGEGDLTAGIAMGINIESGIAGVGTLNPPSLSMIVSCIATLAGTGALSADMVGVVQMVSGLSGSGAVTAALKVLAGCVANITSSGSVAASLRGTLTLECDITPFTDLSPENLAASVWNSVAASYNDAGTMGKKMNDAGSAGNPWAADAASNNDPGTMGKKMNQALSKSLFMALK